MKKTTEELNNHIKSGTDVKELESSFILPNDAIDRLTHRINAKGISKKQVVNKITPGDSNGYKYLSGNRVMKRDLLLKVCIACQFSLEETNETLKQFNFMELYPRMKRDFIIKAGINYNKSIDEINDELGDNQEQKL